jgi:hypothetical protein
MKFYLCALAIVLIAGCSDGRPKRVPISGQVLIDGKPLTYGYVQLVPADSRSSEGKLDSDGRFTLACFDRADGAVLGRHAVAVLAGETISSTKTRWHAPKKYADHRTSGLTEEISGSNENLVIKITWDGGKPFVEDSDSGEGKSIRPGTRGFN